MVEFDFDRFRKEYKDSKYEILEKEGTPYFKVTLVGDINDGDYLTTINKYDEQRFNDKVIDELMFLRTRHLGYSNLEDMETELLYVRLPFDGQSGMDCHSLVEMDVEYVDAHGTVYKVEILGLPEYYDDEAEEFNK